MYAKFANPTRAVNPRDNPRLLQRYQVITPAMQVPIDLRIYGPMHISSRPAVYADLWVQHGSIDCSGSGKAGSAPVPYDQAGEAAARAIAAAGITLWDGHKRLFSYYIPDALGAIAQALGLTEWRIIT